MLLFRYVSLSKMLSICSVVVIEIEPTSNLKYVFEIHVFLHCIAYYFDKNNLYFATEIQFVYIYIYIEQFKYIFMENT